MERAKEIKIEKIVYKKGDNPNPIISKMVVIEISKIIPQKSLSKNSLLHRFA
jgi:hypothetical protein